MGLRHAEGAEREGRGVESGLGRFYLSGNSCSTSPGLSSAEWTDSPVNQLMPGKPSLRAWFKLSHRSEFTRMTSGMKAQLVSFSSCFLNSLGQTLAFFL